MINFNNKTHVKVDVFQKFIIETYDIYGDCMIMSKITYHKQLATDISKVKGGGWWEFDKENSIFMLYGDSDSFGKAKIEDIAYCVQRNKVFLNSSLKANISNKFKFLYRYNNDEIIDLHTYNVLNIK